MVEGLSLGIKHSEHEIDHTSPSSAAWSILSVPSYVLMVWCISIGTTSLLHFTSGVDRHTLAISIEALSQKVENVWCHEYSGRSIS